MANTNANQGRGWRIPAAVGLSLLVLGVLWWTWHRGGGTRVADAPRPGAAALAPTPAPTGVIAVEDAHLMIVVRDDSGPLAGATVRLTPQAGEPVVLDTGSDGAARADHLAPGSWRVSASAPGHLPAALPARQLAAASADTLTLQLASGGRTLRGTVSDVSGGPVAGARVDAARLTADSKLDDAVATALTGTDGTYQMTVAIGAQLVGVASADYAPQTRQVEVGPAGAVANFALVPGGVIEGVVVDDRTGAPVAGAAITARRDSRSLLLAEIAVLHARAGDDGQFRLTGARPGAWQLTAIAGPGATRVPVTVTVGVAEQIGHVELRLAEALAIRGRVVDRAGEPAPGAEVRAHAGPTRVQAIADAHGEFTLANLRPGRFQLVGGGSAYLDAGPTNVALIDRDVDGAVVRVERGLAIHGHVEPRQACTVSRPLELNSSRNAFALTPDVTTDADGEFTIAPLLAGPARLVAHCASGDQGALATVAMPGLPAVVLAVTAGGVIAGQVVDGDGKPAAGVTLVAHEVSTGAHLIILDATIANGAHAIADAAGKFELRGLAAGTYGLTAMMRGKPLRPHAAPPALALTAAEHKTGVVLAVDLPVGVISGTVTDAAGTPIPDAWISAYPDLQALLGSAMPDDQKGTMVFAPGGAGGGDDGTASPVLTDASGHFALTDLFRTRYTVIAEALHGQLRARAVNLTPDATVNLRAADVSSLTGTVRGPDGPVALFTVDLHGPSVDVRSFTGGAFRFDHLDPGTYSLRVDSDAGSGDAKVTLVSGQPATIAITIAGKSTVTGRLVDRSGAPLAGLPAAIIPDGPVRIISIPPPTDDHGRFRVEAQPGPAQLIVFRAPQPFLRHGLTVEAGKPLDLGTIVIDDAAPPQQRAAPHITAQR